VLAPAQALEREPEVEAGPHIPLFAALGAAEFTALLKAVPLIRLDAGKTIIEQGAAGDSLYAVLSGRVRVSRADPSGRRELAILEPGAVFGELAVLTGSPRSARVVAEVDDTTLLEVSRERLDELSDRFPSVGEGLAALARRRILSNLMAVEPLFSGLKRSERLALSESFLSLEATDGVELLGPGSDYDGLLVVGAGQVEVQGPEGTSLLGPGALVGDEAVLRGTAPPVVVTTERALVLNLPAANAAQLAAHPSVASRRDELIALARARSNPG
jgi:cAMP-dependent protein kinase regulator